MANREATYFYAPTWDSPPDRPIKVGNVISSVKEPHRPRFYCPPSDESDVSSTSDQETFFFKTLETTHFIPTTEYLQKCVEAETLQRYLEITSYRKPVYIITGVKVVTGAEVNTSKSGTIGGDITVEVDGTVWTGGSVPIGGGSGIEGKTAKSQGTKWEGSGDFVFAFRVSKVVVKKSGEVNEEEYRKGAILNSGREVKQADFTL
ncbi:hypothetical protein FIE12Z_3977 [Fusarium flagelliforme]|uniref:Uncharacterized protein n=1 Tax=Fusarium flagelliforme TaxID=2675880 RepID=A0A395MV19_9HYPO|nr:hypothetical protein FIE12Z_3977 [Fusarium flagelliforme]